MSRLLPTVTLAALAFSHGAISQQQDFSDVTVTSQSLGNGVHMLVGRGGNIGVSAGEDGVFVIDDQYAPLVDKILKAIRAISDKPVRFVINTHWHGDHTGGNERLGKRGSIIVAHDRVRARLNSEQFMAAFNRTAPAQPKAALPVITFADSVTFHLNGDEIRVRHVPAAHTDGDAFIHFVKANVIHAGDLFFNGFYPFVDVGSGGKLKGMIAGADQMLALADAQTKIIPGHGPLADRTALQSFRDMLATITERIEELKAAGKTREEVVAAKPSRDFDAEWGDGFLKPDRWIGLMYDATD